MIKVIAFVCIVVGVLAVLWLALVSDCDAGNCKAFKWQQTTLDDCKCWYRGCDGKCTREGMWDGGSLTCTCLDISTCGNEITGQATPKPTPTIPSSLPKVGPAPTPYLKLPTVETCPWPWYPGGSLYLDEIRVDPVYGDTWKCSTDGKLVEVQQDIEAEEELVVEYKRWPGGFRGCYKTYGSGWHLSRGECAKTMRVCIYPSAYTGGVEQRAVVGAKDSCDRY